VDWYFRTGDKIVTHR